jgi:hypothetical protein
MKKVLYLRFIYPSWNCICELRSRLVATSPLKLTSSEEAIVTSLMKFVERSQSYVSVLNICHFKHWDGVLEELLSLSILDVHISDGSLIEVPGLSDTIFPALTHLTSLSACALVISQILEAAGNASPPLTRLTLDEGVDHDFLYDNYDGDVSLSHFPGDYWENRSFLLGTTITHLILTGSPSKEFSVGYIYPRVSSCTRVKHLTLRGANLSPILEAMDVDGKVLPNVVELVLEETDILGDVIRKLINTRQYRESQKLLGWRRIENLVLDRCKGVDRAFCEDVIQKVDKFIVYC